MDSGLRIAMGGSHMAGTQLSRGRLYYLRRKCELSLRAFEQYLKAMPNTRNAKYVKALIERLQSTLQRK